MSHPHNITLSVYPKNNANPRTYLRVAFAAPLVVLLLCATVAWSQQGTGQGTGRYFHGSSHVPFNFGVGAGFSTPVQDAGNSLDTGWNVGARGGLNAGSHLDADLDFQYSHTALNGAALALFGEPGGSVGVWSLQLQPVLHLAPRHSGRANAYATAGFGIFHRNLSLTRPAVATGIFCDPFFGCYPLSYGTTAIVASFTTVKPGFNAGAGLEFPMGHSGAALFAEARYQRMFTNHGADFSYVPVTFGFRW
jgi:outer membrane protein with beta-barrel domain